MKLLLVETSPPGVNGSMSRYSKLVSEALASIPGFEDQFELRSLHLSSPRYLRNRFSLSVETWFNHLWLLIRGAAQIRRCGADIVHLLDGSYGYLLNGRQRGICLATVHDLIPVLQQRGLFGNNRTSALSRRIVNRTLSGLRRASKLISVSENTRRDLVRVAALDADSVTVVPIALDPIYASAIDDKNTWGGLEVETDRALILHVGNNGTYKNRVGVLRIFARIAASTDARLLMVGPAPTEVLRRLTADLGLSARVEFIGDIDDGQLSRLYRAANLLLFPSLYEGFGWPPLEAMACGCPVVCSVEGSLAEVVGNAALTAPARDENELARLCLQVLQNPAVSADLSAKGKAHARQFTLQRMGEQLLDVYRAVLREHEHVRSPEIPRSARAGS